MHPVKRKSGLLSTQLPDGEIVIYDAETESYHHLNAACAAVWHACEAAVSAEDLVAAGFTTPTVERALGELVDRKLLEEVWQPASTSDLSRRGALRQMAGHAAVVAMLPAISTLAMPRRGAAQTQQPMDSPPPPPPNGICDGGVTLVILKYIGAAPLAGPVQGRRRNPEMSPIIPAQNVGTPLNPRYQFAIIPLGGLFDPVANGRLANNFTLFVGTTEVADFHTSCSSPIFPGMPVGGGFVITEVHSRNGGSIGAPAASAPAATTTLKNGAAVKK